MSDAIDSAQQRDEFFRETAIQEHFNRGIRNVMNCGKCIVCQAEWEMMHGK